MYLKLVLRDSLEVRKTTKKEKKKPSYWCAFVLAKSRRNQKGKIKLLLPHKTPKLYRKETLQHFLWKKKKKKNATEHQRKIVAEKKSQRYFTRGSASPQEEATKKKKKEKKHPFPKNYWFNTGKDNSIKLKKYNFSDKKKKIYAYKMVTGRVEWAHFFSQKQNIEPIIAFNRTNGYFSQSTWTFFQRKKPRSMHTISSKQLTYRFSSEWCLICNEYAFVEFLLFIFIFFRLQNTKYNIVNAAS